MFENRKPEHFGPLMGFCDHQIQILMGRRLKQYDVSPMQCHTLTFLRRAQGEATQKQLEQFLMVKPSTVNGIVDRLEAKGFVTRVASKEDARCRILHLTEKGQAFYDEFTEIVSQVNGVLERGFSPEELAQFRDLLSRLADNLTREVNQ